MVLVMNGHKLVVVAGGTGRLGRLIVESLLEHPGVKVRILAREPGRPEIAAMAQDRVELVGIDLGSASDAERIAAVEGAFAVVSALQGGPDVIIGVQLELLRAAKAAGARRFLPSDYSYDFFTLPEGVNVNSDWRRTLAERARAEASPSFEVVHVMQGMFADRQVLGFLGLFDGSTIRYWGDGTTPIDWTTWEDTARFVAAAALDDREVPERLYVSGDRMGVLELAELWQAAHGRTLAHERLGSLDELAEETRRRLATEPASMHAWLPLMYAQAVFGGRALLGPRHNARYPHIEAESVAQAIARGVL